MKYDEEPVRSIQNILDKVYIQQMLPKDWEEAVIFPMHKKCTKMDCANYRGMALLTKF